MAEGGGSEDGTVPWTSFKAHGSLANSLGRLHFSLGSASWERTTDSEDVTHPGSAFLGLHLECRKTSLT